MNTSIMASAPVTVKQHVQPLALYRPTTAEIDQVLAKAARAWPALKEQLATAREILCGGLNIDNPSWDRINTARWTIPSGRPGLVHSVIGSHRYTCSCHDHAPLIPDPYGGRRMCAHIIAVAAYVRILQDHLNADIRSFTVGLSVLHTGVCGVYAKRLGAVFAERDNRGIYHFDGDASPVRYSLWLARRVAAEAMSTAQVA